MADADEHIDDGAIGRQGVVEDGHAGVLPSVNRTTCSNALIRFTKNGFKANIRYPS